MNYILTNLNKKKVVFDNLAYANRLVQYKFNIVKTHKKD